jgi:tripartite-type tricarboxylate transporter receptor subunit TctC
MLSKDVALAALLKPEAVKYDPRKFSFIGSLYPYSAVFTVWHTKGIKTWRDALKKEVVVAATGKSAHEYVEMALLREFTGMKLRAVTGYRGASSMYLAMERGEVDARIGGWIGLKAVKPHYIAEKKVDVILQTGLTREHDLPDVPTMVELAPSPEAKKLFELLSMGSPVGWALSMPPNVPADRVAAWRKAFDAMVKDPGFLAAARKYNAEIDPRPGLEVQAAVEKTMAADPATVARIKQVGAR